MIFQSLLLAVCVLLLGLLAFNLWAARRIDRNHPPIGNFVTVDGVRLHYARFSAHAPAGAGGEAPVVLFLHGATSNLRDPLGAFGGRLDAFDAIFLDRPGLGHSERASNHSGLTGQAGAVAKFLDALDVDRAIVVGHSFGGAVAARFAVDHGHRCAGLIFLAPASHPWPGGKVAWYHAIARRPFLGRAFCWLAALPGGLIQMKSGVACVFSPNRPPYGYVKKTGALRALLPRNFRHNSADIGGLYRDVTEAAPLYRTIDAPSIIITGDCDTVVYEHIHSGGLARDIAGSRLVVVPGCGHKPDYVAADLAIAAIEAVASPPDRRTALHERLDAMALEIGERIAGERFGPYENCALAKPDEAPALLRAAMTESRSQEESAAE